MSISWDTVTSAIVTLVGRVSVGFFITQIAHVYLWDGKNENGTSKSPWAPSPSNLPFYWKGYKAFRFHSCLALTDWSKKLQTSIYTVKLIPKRVIVLSHADVVRKALVELEQSNWTRSITIDAIETVMGDQGKTVFTAQFSANWGRLRRAINRVMRDVVVEVKGSSTLVQEEG
ncbi:hypothetical protein BDB00DRAFT_846474 [Zychaea mexicana]|uniref:uncharacterized protein n=1 Tax=Zychaea mexicana TaxID=64656 RepID=UPI0022FEB684|nr:uncharacterized protein BDB00DRAFT_846474 [Zychaea mexicana]KAI9488873.1 hypothetical protein BDB00DRAFT_846474 [Zychaea mexicana]